MSGILSAFVGGTYSSAPVNTVAPAVTGTAQVRQTLSCSTGTWTGVPTPTFTYEWFITPNSSTGSTGNTYTLTGAAVGKSVFCKVTATNIISAVTASSNATATVTAVVPLAPTIGTATALTGGTSATVSYTESSNNGGATITSYTAVSSPGGFTGSLSTPSSGTITVSGLSPLTSYTFMVYATNSVGSSAPSSASNSITTPAAIGQAEYTTAGTYTWYAPAAVTSVSAVAIGGGAGSYGGGGGGGLGWTGLNISVTPGNGYTVQVGAANDTTGSYFIGTGTVAGYGANGNTGGSWYGDNGGNGGTCPGGTYPGGGGAGGYTGNGGAGANYNGDGNAGSGGGGGGGGGGQHGISGGAGGGGVGIYGAGGSGYGGAGCNTGFIAGGGGGGSGGGGGQGANSGGGVNPGGLYGGNDRNGAVRIIWGPGRSYPYSAT